MKYYGESKIMITKMEMICFNADSDFIRKHQNLRTRYKQ